ncbi:hypothetical protein GGI12_001652 [Dipsacomyces acuminosporus]|nr:hypothetical protein GGI12_001652 [Dipsacomyces acuminosporus]
MRVSSTYLALALASLAAASPILERRATVCGTDEAKVAALTPLLTKLGLQPTIAGVKTLLDKLLPDLANLVNGPGINSAEGVSGLVNNLVTGLLGSPLDLGNTLSAVANLLNPQLPCIIQTLIDNGSLPASAAGSLAPKF